MIQHVWGLVSGFLRTLVVLLLPVVLPTQGPSQSDASVVSSQQDSSQTPHQVLSQQGSSQVQPQVPPPPPLQIPLQQVVLQTSPSQVPPQGQFQASTQVVSQSPTVLRPDDHFILRYYVALERVVQPVMVQVLQLLTNGCNNFKQLIFKPRQYSNSQYKKDFNHEQRQKLNSNISSDKYDISLLYKLLQTVCSLAPMNSAEWATPQTLEYDLWQLKKHRNDFAHEDLTLTCNSLENCFLLLEECCRTALVTTGLRTRRRVVEYVQKMEKQFEEVLTGSINLWEPYRKGMQELQLKQRTVLVKEGKQEIRKLAQKLRILNPFIWLLEDNFDHLDVGNIYVDVNINSKGQVKTQDLLTAQLSSGKYPDVLIISGAPGIGKTSFVRFLLNDWASRIFSVNGIYNFDLVLLVELRYVTCDNIQEFITQEILPQSCRSLNAVDVIPTLQELSVLWLVDGFDEASTTTQTLIKGLLKKFCNSKIIITTRTDCVKELELLVGDMHLSHITFQITGFAPEQWITYAEKLFSVSVKEENKRQHSCSAFLQFMKDREQEMWAMFRVPLYVAFLVVLWLEDKSVIKATTTTTNIYHTLLDLIINRMTRRLQQHCVLGLTDHQIRRNISCLLDLLGEMFWENMTSYSFILLDNQIKDLEDLCENLHLPFKESLAPFFLVVVKKTTTGTTEEYRPLHKTVQEFLAAQAFCNAMIAQDCDVLSLAAQWKIKHQRNKVKPELIATDYTNRFERLYDKEDFVMTKLHEDCDIVFDDYEFITHDILSNNCFCPYYMIGPIEGKNEFERDHCKYYFQSVTYTTLVFQFMCGYLKMRDELTKTRVEQIVYVAICDQDYVRRYKLWLTLIQETGEDDVLLEELKSQIFPYQWNPRPFELSLVGELLRYVTPEALNFHLCENNEDNDLKDVLHICSTHALDISLDLRGYSLEKASADIAEDCLNILLDEGVSCRLTSLGCPLNKASVELLHHACHLQELCVRIDSLEDLQTLAQALNNCDTLQNLCIFLNFDWSQVPVKMLPTFKLLQCVRPASIFSEDYANLGMLTCEKQNIDDEGDMIGVKRHAFRKPLVRSHKLMYKLWKNYKCKKRQFSRMPSVAITPYPKHLQVFRYSGLAETIQQKWNMPSAHCNDVCSDIHSDPVLCHDACGHKIRRADPDTLWPVTVSDQTKEECIHHQRAIKYHKTSLRKLRLFYTYLYSLIFLECKQRKLTFKNVYDPYIKMVCCRVPENQLFMYFRYTDSYILKVCELLIYVHKISIREHQNFLSQSRQSPSELCSPVKLIFRESFSLADAQTVAAVVRKLCVSPQAVYLFMNLPDNITGEDIVRYIWCLGEAVPTVQRIGLKVCGCLDPFPPPNWDWYRIVDNTIRWLIYKSAPKFKFRLSWAANTRFKKEISLNVSNES